MACFEAFDVRRQVQSLVVMRFISKQMAAPSQASHVLTYNVGN